LFKRAFEPYQAKQQALPMPRELVRRLSSDQRRVDLFLDYQMMMPVLLAPSFTTDLERLVEMRSTRSHLPLS